MHARIGFELDEGLDARRQIVIHPRDAAILIEVAIIVARAGSVGELGILVLGVIDRAGQRHLKAVEILLDAERAAGGGVDRIFVEADLHVRAARVIGPDTQS